MSSVYILGISSFYHDSAACLVRDGEICACAQEERFTRKKHDSSFPLHSVRYCLVEAGITAKDLALVVFYDKPFIEFERTLRSYLAFVPRGLSSFIRAMPSWIKRKLWIKETIAGELGFDGKIIFTQHHEAHAASAFFPSPFQRAAVLTIDGVGEWATTGYGLGRDNRLQTCQEIHFPHSLGLLYSAFTTYLGFGVNSGEYKVMGLAPYGEPKYRDLILSQLLDLKEDGSFKLNMKYFGYCAGLKMTTKAFEELFGGSARRMESRLTQKDMDIAASIQSVAEEVMLRMARYVREQTGEKNLCLAGGVALNCVGNGRIGAEKIFENIWVQPAASDSGGALGAALFGWYQFLGNSRQADDHRDFMKGAYLGPQFEDVQIRAFLEEEKVLYTHLSDEVLLSKTAELIAAGKVVGWFQGRMEFGPRALGNRSILADARSPKMQELLNLKIKFRESFRPFAPSVLKEKASSCFELETESPYMLLVANVKKDLLAPLTEEESQLKGLKKLWLQRSSIPAVTHVDNSARIQTVSKEQNALFYRLIKAFDEKYGCPVVVNTSFNIRGEPIVCTPEDAYQCFMRTNMDYLVMGHYLIEKKAQLPLDKDIGWLKEFDLD